MAKKAKPPEHENLERWLVSYADFMTLLFATFVVLYALSQTDVAELSKIDESLQRAFSKVSILNCLPYSLCVTYFPSNFKESPIVMKGRYPTTVNSSVSVSKTAIVQRRS